MTTMDDFERHVVHALLSGRKIALDVNDLAPRVVAAILASASLAWKANGEGTPYREAMTRACDAALEALKHRPTEV